VHQVGILDNWRDPQKMPNETQGVRKSDESVGEMLRAE
jgi:hypothetical protein